MESGKLIRHYIRKALDNVAQDIRCGTLKWTDNVEDQTHIDGGVHSIMYISSQCFAEVWRVHGGE